VYIEYKPTHSFDDVYLKNISVGGNKDEAHMILNFKLSGGLYTKYTIRIEMRCGDSEHISEHMPQFIAGKINIRLPKPKLWWPKGRGEANLYEVKLTLLADGEPADTCVFKHGIRTVELLRTSLTTSTRDGEFVFKINGEKVFCKGSNWVPVDAFHCRDRERIPKIMEMVNDLNCNMLRCWGGNVYEDEVFYDICDASGIMVWQDFGMACSIYPQDADFRARIKQEAECVVKRLRGRASVVLWSGDNECDESYSWGYTKTDPNTNVLTRVVLPEAVRIHDGSRPYIGSSPFFDREAIGHDRQYLTEMHLWGPRDYFKSKFYITSLCHFVSEIGYHGCPGRESVEKFISKDKAWPCFNEEWTLHATSPVPGIDTYDYRVELMNKQVAELFTEIPDNLDDFAFASQTVQAEAKKFFVEMFRIAKWKRTGILWWNIMDGWPQFSDAIVDYYFNKKLAYHFIKNSQQDICVMLDEPESWNQRVVVSNDTRYDRKVHLDITDVESGERVFEGEFTAYADAATVVGSIPYKRNLQRLFVLRWSGEVAGQNHYLAGQPPFDLADYKKKLMASGLYEVK
jgi:beta-mannosidase